MRSYNVGNWDRNVRYAVGIALPVVAIFSKKSTFVRTLFWIIGLDGFLTAYFQFSPLNKLLGISTYQKKKTLLNVLPFAR